MFNLFKKEKRAVLNQQQMDNYYQFINANYGKVKDIYSYNNEDMNFNILVIPPRENHNYYTLATMGIQAIPLKQLKKELRHMEFVINIAPDWQETNKEDLDNGWVINVLTNLAYSVLNQETTVFGSTFDYNAPLAHGSNLTGILIELAREFPPKATMYNYKNQQVIIYGVHGLTQNEIIKIRDECDEELREKIACEPFVKLKR